MYGQMNEQMNGQMDEQKDLQTDLWTDEETDISLIEVGTHLKMWHLLKFSPRTYGPSIVQINACFSFLSCAEYLVLAWPGKKGYSWTLLRSKHKIKLSEQNHPV